MHKLIQRTAPALTLALGFAVSGCDVSMTINGEEGVPLSELDQSGDPPTELIAAGSDKVIVTQSDTLTISVEGDDEAVEKVRFVRDGDSLGVSREGGSWWDDAGGAIIRIGMPAPTEIVLAGSGEVEVETIAWDAELVIGGSGSMSIDKVEAERLEVTIGGSGSLKAAGTAKELEMSIGGSGSGNLAALKADDVEISIGGSGSVKLMSDGKVEASIGGSGSIDVVGSADCKLDSFGSGSLNCRPGKEATAAKDEASEEAGEDEAAAE